MRRPEPVEGAGLGIYQFGARFYSPKLGRFLSADTIILNLANPQLLNRYSYVNNNPLRYTDPTGHMMTSDDEGGCYICTTTSGGGTTTGGGGGGDGGGGDDWWDDDGGGGGDGGVSNVAAMATVLDTGAALMNGGYALVGDVVGLVCEVCYGAVLWGYQYYIFIPNSISSISMVLWIFEGVDTGENNLTFTQTPQETEISVSVAQDTIVAVGTNIAGWTVLKEPNLAFGVDAAVAGYDYGRMGMIPLVDLTIPAWINPTITYSTSTGLDFSWQK